MNVRLWDSEQIAPAMSYYDSWPICNLESLSMVQGINELRMREVVVVVVRLVADMVMGALNEMNVNKV